MTPLSTKNVMRSHRVISRGRKRRYRMVQTGLEWSTARYHWYKQDHKPKDPNPKWITLTVMTPLSMNDASSCVLTGWSVAVRYDDTWLVHDPKCGQYFYHSKIKAKTTGPWVINFRFIPYMLNFRAFFQSWKAIGYKIYWEKLIKALSKTTVMWRQRRHRCWPL